MAAPADAKRELDLVEKVEWRILSAASDEGKLQSLLKVYLAPLLLKAGSDHVSVRNKVSASFHKDLGARVTDAHCSSTGHINMPDHQQTCQGSQV